MTVLSRVEQYLEANYRSTALNYHTDGLYITGDGKLIFTNHSNGVHHGHVAETEFKTGDHLISMQQATAAGWIRVTWTIDGRHDPRVDSVAINIASYTRASKASFLDYWVKNAYKYQKYGVTNIKGFKEFTSETDADRWIRRSFTLTKPVTRGNIEE